MKMKLLSFYMGVIVSIVSTKTFSESTELFPEAPSVTIDGVGSRALGLGNNYTALSSDYSATFWNPAGLAFLPVRVVDVGFSGVKSNGDTKFNSTNTEYSRSMIQFSNAGLVRSLPTKRGGFAFALGFTRPYSLKDLRNFSGSDQYIGTSDLYIPNHPERGILSQGQSLNYDKFKLYNDGNLDFWSIAAGWQIAKGFGVGATVSFVTGNEKRHTTMFTSKNGKIFDSVPDLSSKVNYSGYDIRFGGLYQINQLLTVGIRVEMPHTIYYKYADNYGPLTGKLNSSLSGAIGIATALPFATITGDISVRSPNPDVDEGDLAYWKIGAGAGVEVPLQKTNTILRAGYKWQELDLTPYAEYQGNKLVVDRDVTVTADDNLQMFSGGVTFVLSKSISFDLAYVYSFYSTTSTYRIWKNNVTEKYSNQRGCASISVGY